MAQINDISRNPPPSPPHRMTWQVLEVVAASGHLDPKTLAAASCVSRSWSLSLSSDYLWKPYFSTAFPSLTSSAAAAASLPETRVSYRRLYSVCHVAAAKRRRVVTPPKPRLCLSDLTFTVHVQTTGGVCVLLVSKGGKDLLSHSEGRFLFDIDVNRHVGSTEVADVNDVEEVRIVWNVVLGDWKAAFVMMDVVGKVRFGSSSEAEGWFSDELPAADCCLRDGGGEGSGISADFKLAFCGGCGGRKVERVSVGMMSVAKWRYITIEDGLRYLQCFLLPHVRVD